MENDDGEKGNGFKLHFVNSVETSAQKIDTSVKTSYRVCQLFQNLESLEQKYYNNIEDASVRATALKNELIAIVSDWPLSMDLHLADVSEEERNAWEVAACIASKYGKTSEDGMCYGTRAAQYIASEAVELGIEDVEAIADGKFDEKILNEWFPPKV